MSLAPMNSLITESAIHLMSGYTMKTGVYQHPSSGELVLLTKDSFETSEVTRQFGSIMDDFSGYLNALEFMLATYDYLGEL